MERHIECNLILLKVMLHVMFLLVAVLKSQCRSYRHPSLSLLSHYRRLNAFTSELFFPVLFFFF